MDIGAGPLSTGVSPWTESDHSNLVNYLTGEAQHRSDSFPKAWYQIFPSASLAIRYVDEIRKYHYPLENLFNDLDAMQWKKIPLAILY